MSQEGLRDQSQSLQRLTDPHGLTAREVHDSAALAIIQEMLHRADVRVNGDRPWDMVIHDPGVPERILAYGSLGLGESYMEGHWHAERLDEYFTRVMAAHLDREVAHPV
ncbi:MAG TPA: cyclopropane-fatty-acyl-phospholipid synthase, partial [Thioalkalivibrio sp.]|nr:cyclopropane-fatty-acyl-phospholipid synthase [Thioalkalivibrio sp.]